MLVVGVGGTLRSGSSSEVALRIALDEAAAYGAEILCFSGEQLRLPLYEPHITERSAEAAALVAALRAADGVIISSPGYHGAVSGLVKNALDYAEDMARDARTYLDGVPVGCIGLGFGCQAAVATMEMLRSISHALRGWATPYGCALQTTPGLFSEGACSDPGVEEQLRRVGQQVACFGQPQRARLSLAARSPFPERLMRTAGGQP